MPAGHTNAVLHDVKSVEIILGDLHSRQTPNAENLPVEQDRQDVRLLLGPVPAAHELQLVCSALTTLGSLHGTQEAPNAENVNVLQASQDVRLALGPLPASHELQLVRWVLTTLGASHGIHEMPKLE